MKIPKRAPPVTPEYRKMIEDLHKESETFHNRETMKCPKCGWKLVYECGEKFPYCENPSCDYHPCPKCGKEMREDCECFFCMNPACEVRYIEKVKPDEK